MNFLTPWTIAIAAGLTIPPLVALYFLKLRRQEVPISSTYFWKRAVQDLQVNAPFQKLRRNLLMLLQLFVLALAAAALGQPLLRQQEKQKKSLVIMIDRSASMNIVEPDERTRLQRAKDEASKLIEQMDESERAMIITFSDRAQVQAPFSSDQDELEQAIEAITPSEGLSRLAEAVALAKARTQTQIVDMGGPSEMVVSGGPPAKVALFSDGQIEDAETVSLERMAMEIYNVGVRDDNVGIVSLQASRYYERPEIMNVVAGVQNFGREEVEVDVELFIEANHVDIKTLHLGPGMASQKNGELEAEDSMQIVVFDELEFESSGVIEVRLAAEDALDSDNRAYAIIPPPRHASVLLVTPGSYWLKRALSLSSLPIRLSVMTLEQYEQAREEEITEGGRSRFEVVIFGGCTSSRLPIGNYAFFGSVPSVEGFGMGEVVEIDSIFNWDESHSIMRYVEPSNVDIESWKKLVLPENAVSLMDATGGTVLSTVNHAGNRYLICAFEPTNSTWPLREHFIIFMSNAIQFLSGNLRADVEFRTQPGDALAIKVPKGRSKVTMQRPDGSEEEVHVGNLQTAHYGKTDLVGLYRVRSGGKEIATYAVNLFSPSEGRVHPNADLVIGGEPVETKEAVQITNVPLWPWLLAGVLAFLFLEWAVYSKRILV